MTDRGTTTYRRIGTTDETVPAEAPPSDAGSDERAEPALPPMPALRRISDASTVSDGEGTVGSDPVEDTVSDRHEDRVPDVAPPPAPLKRARPIKLAKAQADPDEWSVPALETLDAPESRADDEADEDDDAEAAAPATKRTRAAKARPGQTSTRTRPAQTAAQPVPSSRRPLVLVSAVAVVLLAAVVVLGVLVIGKDANSDLRSSALSTARTDGMLLSSYDYHNLTGPGSDWSKVEAVSDAQFRKNFLSTSASLGKLLTQYTATATGKVIVAGLASFSSSRAVVLLFIDQTVSNTSQKGGSSTEPLRSELTLVRQHGKWLIDDLQVPK